MFFVFFGGSPGYFAADGFGVDISAKYFPENVRWLWNTQPCMRMVFPIGNGDFQMSC